MYLELNRDELLCSHLKYICQVMDINRYDYQYILQNQNTQAYFFVFITIY